jgi:hypothetical protein
MARRDEYNGVTPSSPQVELCFACNTFWGAETHSAECPLLSPERNVTPVLIAGAIPPTVFIGTFKQTVSEFLHMTGTSL